VGELFASDPAGLAISQPAGSGMTVLPGSELSAGVAAATLKLARGGQVRICPRSSLNINRGGTGLMLGLGSGSIEIDYRLAQSATDVLVTPDFNIRLAGPAAYHFAVGVNSKGDTCFKGLQGNGSGVVFSELLGEDSYGVMADEGTLFAGGKLASRAALTSECGCPAPPPTLRAGGASGPGNGPTPAQTPLVPTADVTAPLPPARPGEAHVEVEAPFVFSARDPAKPNTAARLNVSLLPNVFFVQEEDEPAVLVEKPAEVSVKSKTPEPMPKNGANEKDASKKEKKGFLARLKGFFGAMFHR
jgi:hypothetical protein